MALPDGERSGSTDGVGTALLLVEIRHPFDEAHKLGEIVKVRTPRVPARSRPPKHDALPSVCIPYSLLASDVYGFCPLSLYATTGLKRFL